MTMKIVFLGPPGAGKGTQAKLVSEKYQLAHISTGEMLRKAVAAKSELGTQVKWILEAGRLVPDDLVVQIIRERVKEPDCANGYILDGFPRTVAQGEALTKMLDANSEKLTHVLYLELSEEELKKRLEFRRSAEARADDSVTVQIERLRVYQEQTAPLIAYYQGREMLVRVDASGSIEEVQQNIRRALEA